MVPLLALPEGGEWIVILVIVVLLFGAKKLPELTRNAKEPGRTYGGDARPGWLPVCQPALAAQVLRR